VQIGLNCKIGPNVTIGEGVVIGDNVCIKGCTIFAGSSIWSHSQLNNCIVGPSCHIWPYTRLRDVTVISKDLILDARVYVDTIKGMPIQDSTRKESQFELQQDWKRSGDSNRDVVY